MFAIIRGQPKSSTPKSPEKRIDPLEERFRRAPGISKHVAGPMLKPVSRASTEPIISTQRVSSEDELELQDHWLFTSSQRLTRPPSGDLKERVRQPGYYTDSGPQDSRLPLCGAPSANVDHMYIGWQSETRNNTTASHLIISTKAPKPKCAQCVVLSETIDRLRGTLSRSTKTSPTTSPSLETGEREFLGGDKSLPALRNHSVPPVGPRVPEMRQITALSTKNFADRTLRELSAPNYEIPSSSSGIQRSLNSGIRGEIEGNATTLPRGKPQGRCVTFDSIPATRPRLFEARPEYLTMPSNWCADPMEYESILENERTSNPVHDHPGPQRSSSGIQKPAPASQWALTNLPRHDLKPQPPLPEAWASVIQRKNMTADALARRSLSAAVERDNERQQHTHPVNYLHRPDPRPSLPNLRQGPLPGMTRREDTTSVRSRVQESQNRQYTFIPVSNAPAPAPAQEQDLRRRRSMGSALRSSAEGSGLPESQLPHGSSSRNAAAAAAVSRMQAVSNWNEQRQHIERLERETRPMNGRSRHGGEELQGVDYARW